MKEKFRYLIQLLTMLLVMAVVAVRHNGTLLNHDVTAMGQQETLTTAPESNTVPQEIITVDAPQSYRINTTSLCEDVKGYGGTVPLEITVTNGVITDIQALPNNETPNFFESAATLFSQWKGKKLNDAAAMEVNAVTGATFSSKAIIENMQRGTAFALSEQGIKLTEKPAQSTQLPWAVVASIIVVLMAALVPLFWKNKYYRLVQLLLNVAVLGLWSGTFLSYSFFLRALENGLQLPLMTVTVVMLVTAFVYPLFGKKNHYCTHVCPFGSLQELAGRCSHRKLKMSQRVVKRLELMREVLWTILMALMIAGVWFEWINYELFTAFVFQSASVIVIAVAAVFVLLSMFIPHPYCRFVCPTGTLFKITQDNK